MAGHTKKRLGIAPAPSGSWPAFAPGNKAAVVHGTHTPLLTDPIADSFIAEMMAVAPGYMDDASFRYAIRGWAMAETRSLLYDTWMDGLEDEEKYRATGAQAPAIARSQELAEAAARARTRIGLDPVSRVKIGKALTSQGVDLAKLAEAAARSGGWQGEDGEDPVSWQAGDVGEDGSPARVPYDG